MVTLEAAIEELRSLNESVPKPLALPDKADVDEMESDLGVTFPQDYRTYLVTASDVVLGTLEPATIVDPDAHTYLPAVVADARDVGLPDELLPFCEDNGNYYCFNADEEVELWSHDGEAEEKWADLADWITEVWIGEHG